MDGLDLLRRAIRSQSSLAEKGIRTTLAVAIPTGLRWLLAGDALGAPFVLYFPAILIVAVLIGWRSATVTAVASAVAGILLFWPTEYLAGFGRQQAVVLTMFAFSAAAMIAIGHLLRVSVMEIEDRARQSEDFNRELQHRTKNSIQMMRALASQASKATDPEEFYATLGGRLAALAKANELLRFGAREDCAMHDLMEAAVAPFNAGQISFRGPPCRISRNGCTPLMMALHELGTNASKYGALSSEQGRVEIEWTVADNDSPVAVRWQESGGPPVSRPQRKGIGTRLLTANGDVRSVVVDYCPEGVVCDLAIAKS